MKTLNEDEFFRLQRRIGELQSLGMILRFLAELEGQKVELSVFADLGRVIARNAHDVLVYLPDPASL